MQTTKYLNRFLKTNSNRPTTMNNVQILKNIFIESVNAVKPETLIRNQVMLHQNHLSVQNESFLIEKPAYIIGFGKAVLGMALELEKILQDQLKMGLVTVPKGIFNIYPYPKHSKIRFIEGAAHNLPDKEAESGALEIKELAVKLQKEDTLIVLISGGGSALLPLALPPVTLEEKQDLVKKLARKGADIKELNCVRKQISQLKGGKLAELAYPCRVISLILSDVVGDPLDLIASGPTVPNSRPNQAIQVVKKHGLYEQLPKSIETVLETARSNRKPFNHVRNFIIGNNEVALGTAKDLAEGFGFQTAILSSQVEEDTDVLGKVYASLCNALWLKESCKEFLGLLGVGDDVIDLVDKFDREKPICLIAGGETTVVVSGGGLGGRNQQLALAFSVELNKLDGRFGDISLLSCGTDGMDGPTDAAGAIGTSSLVVKSGEQNIKPSDYLENNDSFSFFSKFDGGEALVKVGHTGTNVMDMHVMLIRPKGRDH